MSPATRTRSRTRRKKKRGIPAWLSVCWPLLLGLAVTPVAVRAASVLALSGPSALRLLYPYVVLVQEHAHGFASNQEETLAQWVMYGQFPAYGLLWMLGRRLNPSSGGLLAAVVAHCGGLAAAIFTTPA